MKNKVFNKPLTQTPMFRMEDEEQKDTGTEEGGTDESGEEKDSE